MYKTILVAVDSSEHGLTVLHKAISLARLNDADLVIAHLDEIITTTASIYLSTNVDTLTVDKLSDERLEELRSIALAASIKNVEIVSDQSNNVVHSITHDIFNKVNPDLIVCGASKKLSFDEIFLGTTASGIAKNAKCDVHIVKM